MSATLAFETSRWRIRPAVTSDLPALACAVASPEFPQDLPLARLYKAGELAEWLEKFCDYADEPKLWSITTRSSQTCIGQIALFAEGSTGTYWLSYWLAPEYWARGIAKECIAALLHRDTVAPAYRVVVAAVAEANHRSISVLRGLGFKETTKALTKAVIPPRHICFALEIGTERAA
ncbi:GNAT family N-acetyltransferase [Niveibacterium sp.]|uniref:GNAT family N-acetyltransferase n=1 Tax=Niveibacterium sp. TaxID=2017444 RepID=UPI0035B04D75